MKVLILGGTGMLGHTALRVLSATPGIEAFATIRAGAGRARFPEALRPRLIPEVDVLDADALAGVLAAVRPDAVLNAVGLIKQLGAAKDPLAALPVNALFPHRLARLCALGGARLVHVSTDCVFRGDRGMYKESDAPDAEDLYGRSKLLGEVDAPHAVTLRTSIIGRELGGRNGLVDWFLGEAGPVRGFTRAVFSGLTTDELARVVARHVLPDASLHGVWHVSAAPIDKHALLGLLKAQWGRATEIVPDGALAIDRSLDSSRFRARTGWAPPAWPEMIRTMHEVQGDPA